MKHLKTKLMAAVAMLLVATVMLTSASFAWFTISTAPEVKSLKTQVVVNENLEIALAEKSSKEPSEIPGSPEVGDSYDSSTVNVNSAYTWGNLIDLGSDNTGDAAVADYTSLTKTLRPATLASSTTKIGDVTPTVGTFYYPVYGTDGRVSTVSALETGILGDTGATAAQWGLGNLIVKATGTDSDSDEAGKVYGYYVDYWVRSNISGDLKLQTAADATRSSAGEKGEGTYFKSNTSSGTEPTLKDQNTALKTLADNVQIAFLDITPSVTGATAAASGATPVVATPTKDTTAVGTTAQSFKTTYACDKIITLTANEAKLIRVFVYLEGKDVTNAAASLEDPSFTNGGSLNIQFCMDKVNTSMDAASVK